MTIIRHDDGNSHDDQAAVMGYNHEDFGLVWLMSFCYVCWASARWQHATILTTPQHLSRHEHIIVNVMSCVKVLRGGTFEYSGTEYLNLYPKRFL